MQRSADRLAVLPEFAAKASVTTEMRGAATRQEEALDARDAADRSGAQLESRSAADAIRGSESLSKLEAALLDRFPRQYAYVGGFFKDLRAKRRRNPTDDGGGGGT